MRLQNSFLQDVFVNIAEEIRHTLCVEGIVYGDQVQYVSWHVLIEVNVVQCVSLCSPVGQKQ